MTRVHLDANVLLRFLRDDDPVQSPRARALIASRKEGRLRLVLSVLSLAEVFYAMRASYEIPRRQAAGLLKTLLETAVFDVEREEVILDALARVQAANVDFGDALLAAEAAHSSEVVATFDTDFRRFKDVKFHPWTG